MRQLEQFLRKQNCNIHNFCFGTILSYYQPISYNILCSNSFELIARYGRNRKKLFCFGGCNFNSQDISYSAETGDEKKVEIVHNLEDVFDNERYNRKKRYNTIIRPFNWSQKNDLQVREISEQESPIVEQLHEKWVNLKLSNESTFKIMFPRKRYLKCFYDALENPNYVTYGAFLGGKLVSVRVLYLQHEWAYDLAFFTDYTQGNFLTGFVDILIFDNLRKKGLKFVNRGVELNKGLKDYKTQYPYFKVYYYQTKNNNVRDSEPIKLF